MRILISETFDEALLRCCELILSRCGGADWMYCAESCERVTSLASCASCRQLLLDHVCLTLLFQIQQDVEMSVKHSEPDAGFKNPRNSLCSSQEACLRMLEDPNRGRAVSL